MSKEGAEEGAKGLGRRGKWPETRNPARDAFRPQGKRQRGRRTRRRWQRRARPGRRAGRRGWQHHRQAAVQLSAQRPP